MSKSLQKSVGINLRNLSNYALRYCFHVRDVFIMVGRKAGGVFFFVNFMGICDGPKRVISF